MVLLSIWSWAGWPALAAIGQVGAAVATVGVILTARRDRQLAASPYWSIRGEESQPYVREASRLPATEAAERERQTKDRTTKLRFENKGLAPALRVVCETDRHLTHRIPHGVLGAPADGMIVSPEAFSSEAFSERGRPEFFPTVDLFFQWRSDAPPAGVLTLASSTRIGAIVRQRLYLRCADTPAGPECLVRPATRWQRLRSHWPL